MKTQYEGKLRCATCKSDSHFDYNEENFKRLKIRKL